jgi:dGTPase
MMTWDQLLSDARIGKKESHSYDKSRPPWQMDYDRIVFSSAFRRMQDKTQVFPLSGSDYVRTRLTHSLEVSTVARTIGTMAGSWILDKYGSTVHPKSNSPIKDVFCPADIGTITATGALAHDIGNPPFGHSGEDAIRYWFNNSHVAEAFHPFLSPEKRAEFSNWEGNAEGFRLLARHQMARHRGGLQLTAASLGAYTKYPTAATAVAANAEERKQQATKKPGFFSHDQQLWEEVALALGLIRHPTKDRWCRHPLAYLTEAADDICYRIIDLEDGFRLGRISFGDIESLYGAVAGPEARKKVSDYHDAEPLEKVTHLRSLAFTSAVKQVVDVFIDGQDQFLQGTFEGDIVSRVTSKQAFQDMRQLGIKRVYCTPSVLEIEAAGFEIIPGLLDAFASAVSNAAAAVSEKDICPKASKLLSLIPSEYLGKERTPDPSPYIRLLGVVDYVAGMTDSYALTLYRRIKGVSLPGSH